MCSSGQQMAQMTDYFYSKPLGLLNVFNWLWTQLGLEGRGKAEILHRLEIGL